MERFGFTKGQTVKLKDGEQLFTLAGLRMRGDAAITADLVSLDMAKDYYTDQMVPKTRMTVNLCRVQAA